MRETSDEKLQRADQRVTGAEARLEVAMQPLSEGQRRRVESAARELGIAVASLCIEVERMSEQEGWHE